MRSGSYGTHCRKPSRAGSPSSPPTWTPTGTRACPMVIGRRQVSTSELGAITAGTTVGWAASARSASTGSKPFQAGLGASKTTLGLTVTSICDGSCSARTRQRAGALSRRGRLPTRKLGVQPTGPLQAPRACRGPCQPTAADRWLDMGGSSAEQRSGCSLRGIRGLIVPGVGTTAKPEQCAPERNSDHKSAWDNAKRPRNVAASALSVCAAPSASSSSRSPRNTAGIPSTPPASSARWGLA